MNRLSEILKRLLRRNNLTVTELSRHTGIVQPVIYRLTTGETDNPKLSSLLPIANYFDINLSQLIGEEPLNKEEHPPVPSTTKIPLLNWEDALDYAKMIPQHHKKILVVGLSESAFALVMPDTSMEPMFQRDSLLIFDPLIKPIDRSFILVNTNQSVVFRQLIIDITEQYIKPLNPDFNAFKMRRLEKQDTIIACLVESRSFYKTLLSNLSEPVTQTSGKIGV